MKINMERLRHDRRKLDERIRATKRVLRTTWTQPMAHAQHELLALKLEATELCILRAWLRGRLHVPDPDRCQQIAERRAPAYVQEAA